MVTLNMPPKGSATNASDDIEIRGQLKPVLHRFRLQVDRQTKATFPERATAEKKGREIKKAYPKVQVVVYDAETEERVAIAA
jgi:hypothetical protein